MSPELADQIKTLALEVGHTAYCFAASGRPHWKMSDEDAQELLRMLKSLELFLNTTGEPDANVNTDPADQPAGPCDGQAPDVGGGWYGIYDDTFFLT